MQGLITLIPKKEDSNKVNDLRPITLLEIARKIITKAMTTRIKLVLSQNLLINPHQYCHPGRLIHENIHTLNLLVERAQLKKKNLHAAFLDCSKAFDYVNHNYLIKVLESRNAGNKFLNFIKCFLKGNSKITFNGSLSDDLKIDRGVPQGETMSPFLFILAIDPLLNSIDLDDGIKGVKVGNKRVKVMAYADDLVLIAETKEDLIKMLEHVRVYEKASNAKLNEKKSQLLSFGTEVIDKIGDISQTKTDERVRHLGFFFNQEGLINNLDEIIEVIYKKVKILRNLYPNFTTRVNIWKGYAISSLMYQSEVIVITPQQISMFEKVEKWFLFQANLRDDEVKTVDDLENTYSKITLKRLAQPKKYGGMNLRKIEDIYSASKCKVLMKALQDHGDNKPCNRLLIDSSEMYFKKEGEDAIIHPLYRVESIPRLMNSDWDWYNQCSKMYAQIDKDCTMVPMEGDTVLDLHTNEVFHFAEGDGQNVKMYKVVNQTIPVEINPSTKERLVGKRKRYMRENEMETVDKIVTIGHTRSCDTPVKTVVSKTKTRTWFKRVKVLYPQMEKRKLKKINLRSIFRITLDKKIRPLWTHKHVDWMEQGIDVKGLFTFNLKTTARISDFRRKFLMSYWGKPCKKCHLCGKDYDRMHIFTECEIVEQWENEIYGDASDKEIVGTPIN